MSARGLVYGSVCSGIEAASVAWEPLGFRPAFFAEIDKFPSAVLAHRYPHVKNAGDFTIIRPEDYEPIDILVGGTPCHKRTVTATVVADNGVHYVATNQCDVDVCRRMEAESGTDYSPRKCSHAEIRALDLAGKAAAGATLYVEGHSWICDDCRDAAMAAGIEEIYFAEPEGGAADGPRYKALGNSMAVNVMRWVGQRIALVDALPVEQLGEFI